MSVRIRVLILGFLCAGAAFAGAALVGPWLQAGPGYPGRVTLVVLAIAVVAAAGTASHPFARLGPANLVTFARATLLALVAGLLGEPHVARTAAAAVVLSACAELLDGCDGWLARRSGMASAFGARFDMETDALLIMVLSVLVWQHGKAGAWVVAGGLLRYAFIGAGWVLPWMARPLTPTRRAQTIAVTHATGLIVALAPIVPTPFSAVAAFVTLAALTWSFSVDVGRLWRGEGTNTRA